MLVFTGFIAASTVVYTIVTIRLWRTTRHSVDIARYNAFMAYMTTLGTQIDKAQASDPGAAKLLEALSGVMADVGIGRFLKDIDFAKDEEARQHFQRIAAVLRAHGIDPASVPGIGKALAETERMSNRGDS
jgi:hypothetical protein